MKTPARAAALLRTAALSATILLCFNSCDYLFGTEDQQGILKICFPEDVNLSTKASSTVPDPNNFILSVVNSKGESVFSGTYGSAPEEMMVDPDTYTITAVSREFNDPAFDAPQYGDNQVVKVSSGTTTTVNLCCYQLNSGIQLKIASSFLEAYPSGILFLKSVEGKLMYSYTEKRTAYFKPGPVSLMMNDGGKETSLMSRTLQPQQVLVLSVAASGQAAESGSGNKITISIDTCRNWVTDSFVLGGDNKGGDTESAYSVSQAKAHVGESDVWVQGYIVGGDLSSSKCSFTGPFSSRTNIVIAAKSSCTNKESCLSVQLQKGDIRDALNLVDHPGNLGRQVYLKGDIVESYYGIQGIQSITEWMWKE